MKTPHILLTTDLSDESLRAFGPAAELTGALGGRITVLFVLTELMAMPEGYPYVPVPTPEQIAERSLRAETELRDLAARRLSGLDVTTEVTVARRADEGICEFAKDHGVDWIAMSTHGRSGVRRLFSGSIAESVLRRATVPVILFPPPE